MTRHQTKVEHETYVRFREFVKDKNKVIAQKLGVTDATVSNWQWRGIPHDKILALADIYGFSPQYVANGASSAQNQINNQNGYIGGNVTQSVHHHTPKDDSDWLVITSNDMSPIFTTGDRVQIDRDKTPIAGNYVLAMYEGWQMVRKYRPRYDDDGAPYVQLIATNEDYPPLDSRHQDFTILGVAVEFQRKLV